MKKVLTVVLCLVLAIGCIATLSACNDEPTPPPPVHQHRWTEVLDSNRTSHLVYCAECDESEWLDHEWVALYELNRDEHLAECSVCNLVDILAHEFESGVCVQCGAVQHVHNWQWTGESYVNVHFLKCKDCCGIDWAEHTFAEGSDSCSVCGAPPHTHNWKYISSSEIRTNYHQLYCEECGSSGWQQHTYDANDRCTVCRHVKGTEGSNGGASPLSYVDTSKRKGLQF